MSYTMDRTYSPKTLPPGSLVRALGEAFGLAETPKPGMYVAKDRTLPDGTRQSQHDRTLELLRDVCDLAENRLHVVVVFNDPRVTSRGNLDIQGYGNFLNLNVTSQDPNSANSLLDELQRALGLEPTRVKFSGEVIAELDQRLQRVEQRVFGEEARLTCFISYRFEPEHIRRYALEIRCYLESLGVKCYTAQGYEPRKVEEKVAALLELKPDFAVIIISQGGETAWIRDEIGRVKASGGHIIPLVETGETLTEGLLGNIEYISFSPGHIGDTFLKLLEGVQYVTRVKQAAK